MKKWNQKADGVRWNRPLPFRGLRPILACGRVEVFFFQGERKNQKRVAMGVAMGGVESSAFSSLLRLFFQGKNESKKMVAAEGCRSLLFLGLRPSQLAERCTRSFFREKGRPKGKWHRGYRRLPFHCFSLCFFIFLKSKKKSKGPRPVSCAERYPCSFSKEKEGQKTDNVGGHSFPPFRRFSLSFLSF